MNDETIVPLRPWFDNEFRGFNRNQVVEHIELLEDQVRMLTIDRDEALRLNEDQRRISDDLRRQLDEATGALKRLESSETGLPHATQRMRNMLIMADDEANEVRKGAKRDAETIRGTAATDAKRIRAEAESMAAALREECNELIADLERRREQLEQDHATKTAEIESHQQELRQSLQSEYEKTMAKARSDATELLRQTRQRCEQMETSSERSRVEAMGEVNRRVAQLDDLRKVLLDSLQSMAQFANSTREVVSQQPRPSTPTPENDEPEPQSQDTARPAENRVGERLVAVRQVGSGDDENNIELSIPNQSENDRAASTSQNGNRPMSAISAHGGEMPTNGNPGPRGDGAARRGEEV